MTFGSKHGRRTSTEDSYRDVLQQRKCLATAALLLHFCGALVCTASMTGQNSSPRDDTASRLLFLKVPLPNTDLMNSVSAKECQKAATLNASLNAAAAAEQPNRTNITTIQPHCSRLLPFLDDSRNQCLHMDKLSEEKACATSHNHVHLRFCSQYHLAHILPQGEKCGPYFLARVREIDEAARLLACQFDKLLQLYDCDANYSVSWSCQQCRRVYKQWVCAMVLPFHLNGELIKPCRSVCRLVEQMCPYFHPSVKEQYAGERVFKCIDPDIPDLESISPHSVFGLPGDCYCPHHLDSATEMLDSDVTECELTRQVLRTTTTTGTPRSTETTTGPPRSTDTIASGDNKTDLNSTGSFPFSGTNSSARLKLFRWLISLTILLIVLLTKTSGGIFTYEPT